MGEVNFVRVFSDASFSFQNGFGFGQLNVMSCENGFNSLKKC